MADGQVGPAPRHRPVRRPSTGTFADDQPRVGDQAAQLVLVGEDVPTTHVGHELSDDVGDAAIELADEHEEGRVVAVDDAGHELGDTRPVVAAKVAFGVRDLRHAGSFRGR